MISNNELVRSLREESPLLIDDLRNLLGRKGWGTIARIEARKQAPSFEMVIIYHLLFQAPIPLLIEHETEHIKRLLIKRLKERIVLLKTQYNGIDIHERSQYLQAAYERLQN